MSASSTSLRAELELFFNPLLEFLQFNGPGAALAQRLRIDTEDLNYSDLDDAIFDLPTQLAQASADLISYDSTLLRETLIAAVPIAFKFSLAFPPGDFEGMFRRNFDLCLGEYLLARTPPLGGLLRVLGVIPAEHLSPVMDWQKLRALLGDTGGWAEQTYGWGRVDVDASALHHAVFQSLRDLTSAFGGAIPYRLDVTEAEATALSVEEGDQKSRFPLVQEQLDGALAMTQSSFLFPYEHEAGLVISPFVDAENLAGIAVGAYSRGQLNALFEVATHWDIVVAASAAAELGRVIAFSPSGSEIINVDGTSISLSAALRYLPEDPIVLVSEPSVFVAKAGGFEFKVEHDGSNVSARAALQAVILNFAGSRDGFLARLIPGDAEFTVGELGVRVDRTGINLIGGNGLVWDIPLSVRVGTANIDRATISIDLDNLSLQASFVPRAKIGPVSAVVEGLGVAIIPIVSLERDGEGKLEVHSIPPTGLGLTIDTGAVKGGGFIAHDAEAARYLGALTLDIRSLTVTAFGLLDTKLPDGGDGWSMLVFMAGRFPPMQLGFGFTLLGLGGLVGLHRDIDVNALFTAVRAGKAGRLLAPSDPVRDAPMLARDASTIFPVTRGQHVFGPTAKLGWGSPKPLITLDLALALTLPEPLRLVLIGTLRARIPDERLPLVKLNVDLAGVLDFTASRFDLEGAVYDSVIQAIPLSGGFAVRSCWGARPELAFSVGGLHPAFEPPPNFPQLERMAMDLSKGSNFKLRIEGYFAITSNTLQFGAGADLRVRAVGLEVHGELGFDTLIVFTPFALTVDVRASAAVKRGGRTICSVSVKGRVAGPGPWRVSGSATVEILFFDVDVDFDTSFGSRTLAVPDPVDANARLRKALQEAGAWRTSQARGVLVDDVASRLLPDSPLEVAQEDVPLGLSIDLYGGVPVTGVRKTRLVALRIGGMQFEPDRAVLKRFAPGQLFAMDEAERLAAPAFEELEGGAAFDAAAPVSAGTPSAVPTGPTVTIIDEPEDSATPTLRNLRKARFAPRDVQLRRPGSSATPAPRLSLRSELWVTAGTALAARSAPGSYQAARSSVGKIARFAELLAS